MAQYIDKAALVAEIERRRNICKKIVLDLRTEENKDYYQGKAEAYKETLSFLDTLEMKEAGSEKEVKEKKLDTLEVLEDAAYQYGNIFERHYDLASMAFIHGARWQQQKTDKDMTEALRTEYEKGRADVIADTISWLANCWPQYCDNPNIIDGFKEAIKEE